ncbi:hypothetical protein NIES4071_101710 (plasmid) [Calothrix sp. NIES-4071]|nr:hypothetical protein NIES4071_101710 [Calothrix sp. NIES-4071]BAZ64552.1 hypothetical protein NIES4105_102850 [Calothrix sp. NIES-4105]
MLLKLPTTDFLELAELLAAPLVYILYLICKDFSCGVSVPARPMLETASVANLLPLPSKQYPYLVEDSVILVKLTLLPK